MDRIWLVWIKFPEEEKEGLLTTTSSLEVANQLKDYWKSITIGTEVTITNTPIYHDFVTCKRNFDKAALKALLKEKNEPLYNEVIEALGYGSADEPSQ